MKLKSIFSIMLALSSASALATEVEFLKLQRDLSLEENTSNGKSVWEIIKTSRIDPKKVLVGFDMDGNLNTLGPREVDEHGKETYLRGGRKTREAIFEMSRAGVPWFVVSANNNRKFVASKIHRLGLGPVIPFRLSGDGCLKSYEARFDAYEMEPKIVRENFTIDGHTNYNVYQCHNSIAAVKEGDNGRAFDKHVTLEYIMSAFYPEHEPELLIFVDDSAAKLRRIYNYFKGRPGGEHQKLIVVLWEPHRSNDPEHENALREFEREAIRKSAPAEGKM